MTTKVDEAEAFLREVLVDGPLSLREVEERARAARISASTLRRAKDAAGVVSRHRGHQGSTYQGWWWSINDEGEGPDG